MLYLYSVLRHHKKEEMKKDYLKFCPYINRRLLLPCLNDFCAGIHILNSLYAI